MAVLTLPALRASLSRREREKTPNAAKGENSYDRSI